jgi:ribosomal protein S18 acetylase RimI-like enzyme
LIRRPAFDTWHTDDVTHAAALLRRAYDRASGALFAPTDAPEEWQTYVTNLVSHPGCGTLNPAATAVLRRSSDIVALAMITDIGPHTSHLVQLGVDPSLRRQGVARALLDEVCERLTERRTRMMTLLVAASNRGARRLYDTLGFRQTATFLAATYDIDRQTSTRG